MPAGYLDPDTGVYIFGSTDPSGPMHEVLNRAQTAAADVQLGNESRLFLLESWLGEFNASVPWMDVPSPHTGDLDAGVKLRFRRVNTTVYVAGGLRIDEPIPVYSIVGTLTPLFRPLDDVFTLGWNSNGGEVTRLLFKASGEIITYQPLPGDNDLTVVPLTFWTAS